MIIFFAWFHNSFHEICVTLGTTGSNKLLILWKYIYHIHSIIYFYEICALGAISSNRLFWSIIQQAFLEQIFGFSSSFIEVLHALGVVIWIHNSCCSLGTTIQAEKHQQLEFIILLPHFQEYMGLNEEIYSLFEKKISIFYDSHL